MWHIPLNQGKLALVDDEHYERVSLHKWTAVQPSQRSKTFYATTAIQGRTVYMHRFILNAPKDVRTDHKNRDGLDNRYENLRICTQSQNMANVSKCHSTKTSRYKGVSRRSGLRLWRAQIEHFRHEHIGYFKTEEEAAKAYDRRALELFGDFAALNFAD